MYVFDINNLSNHSGRGRGGTTKRNSDKHEKNIHNSNRQRSRQLLGK